jgi:hypothetical protein
MNSEAIKLMNLDPELCKRRNRLQALRYGVNTATLQLARELPVKPEFRSGRVYKNKTEALEVINSKLPNGAPKLTEEEVLIFTMESASNNFVGDRYLFLGTSTLRNIAKGAEQGFAWMNSHATGSLSTPSQLPFGKAFAGQYERYPSADPTQARFERSLVQAYMLSGKHPNGSNGPSTDDMYAAIMGGTIFDVSMGLAGGDPICDLCGNELRDRERCTHVPGTSRNVTHEQTLVQKRRGVKKGFASYTLENAHPSEVSAVYDGAIPGAGFSVALEALKDGGLSQREVIELSASYSNLISQGDIPMYEQLEYSEAKQPNFVDKVAMAFAKLMAGGSDGDSGPSSNPTPSPAPTPPTPPTPPPTPSGTNYLSVYDDSGALLGTQYFGTVSNTLGSFGTTELVSAEDSRVTELQRKIDEMEGAERQKLAVQAANSFLSDNHLLPTGLPIAETLSRWLADDDARFAESREYTNTLGVQVRATRLELLQQLMSEVPQHDLLKDHALPSVAAQFPGAFALMGDEEQEDLAVSEAREDARKYASAANGKAKKG